MINTDNIGIKATERLVDFCLPGFKVQAQRAPLGKGDVCVPNMRKQFEIENTREQWPDGGLYPSYEEFLKILCPFIPGEITEDGIYTNIRYSKEAIHAVMTLVASS